MDKPITYRDATINDVQEIQRLFNFYITHSNDIYDKQARDASYMKKWWDEKVDRNFPIIVAESESQPNLLLGFSTFGQFRRWEAYDCTVEHSVYLNQSSISKGIGKRLMELLIERAIDQEYHSMIGGIDSANKGSINFHSKLGFVERGRIPSVAFKNDVWLDLVIMQKMLQYSI